SARPPDPRPAAAAAPVGAADRTHSPARRRPRPARQQQRREGPCEGPQSEGSQSGTAATAATADRPAGIDRPRSAQLAQPGAVRGTGDRVAGAGAGRHPVVVHRSGGAVLSARRRAGDESGSAATEGTSRTGGAGGAGGAGPGRGGPRTGHDPLSGHRTAGAGSGRELDRGGHSETGRRSATATAEHAVAGTDGRTDTTATRRAAAGRRARGPRPGDTTRR